MPAARHHPGGELGVRRPLQPWHQVAVDPAEDDRLRVEEVDRPGQDHAQPVPRLPQRGDGTLLAGRGPLLQLGDAAYPHVRVDAGRPQQGRPARVLLQAAVRAAPAEGALRVHDHMADLAREPVGAPQHFAVHHERAAHADLTGEIEEGAYAAESAEPQLGQGRQVGLVVGADGQRTPGRAQRAERLSEDPLCGDPAPAEVGGLSDDAAGDEAGQCQLYADHAQFLFPGGGDDTVGEPGGVGQDLGGRDVAVVGVLGDPDPVGAGEVDGAHGDVVDVDLHTEPRRAGTGELQYGTGAPGRAAGGLAGLAEAVQREQFLDEGGDGGPGESDEARHPGPGDLALVADGTQDQAQVVAPHGLVSGLCRR